MSSKTGAMALQAIGVVALGCVVYFAFLKPDDPGTLSEIAVDDGVTLEAPQRSVHHPGRQRSAPKPKRTPPAREATPAVSTVPVTSAPAPDTPAGSQYTSSVARIIGAVSRGSP